MTNEQETLLNKRVLIFQGSWRYKGLVVVDDGGNFITLLDDRTRHRIMLSRSTITTLEVLDE